MPNSHHRTTAGFSLIEIIVSLAIFSVVVTIAVGALLILIASSEQLRGEQSVMTNLAFAVDSMTREIRAGGAYFCDSRPNQSAAHPGGISNMFNDSTDQDVAIGDETLDCANGNQNGQRYHGLSFQEGGDSITGAAERILYFFDDDTGQLYRRVGGDPAESIVSSGIYIEEAEFFVTGSTPLPNGGSGSLVQPTVTLFIEARESDDASGKPFYMETTITKRQLDI